MSSIPSTAELARLARLIKVWGHELGFANIGITDTDLKQEEPRLQAWLDKGFHGDMDYMASHGMMRARPYELHPGCQRVICASMNYLPPKAGFATNLADPMLGYISRYAGGRDYHKLIRKRMKQLGQRIDDYLTEQGFSVSDNRPFVDSAPILERPLAEKAGLGWTGKHTLLLNSDSGSWFFLSELVINLPLPVDIPVQQNCGACVACIKSCPTNAIVEPYTIDARRCISYLTIELEGNIPEELRPLMGNRIYGCDDCQLVCPVNSQAALTQETDFHIRNQLQQPDLLRLFNWTQEEFLNFTQGSAIRRIGHERWQRNIAVALGNAPTTPEIIKVLTLKLSQPTTSKMLAEHIEWALACHGEKQAKNQQSSEQRKQQRLIRTIKKGLSRDA